MDKKQYLNINLEVPNYDILLTVKDCKEKDIALCKDTNTLYLYTGKKWEPLNAKSENNQEGISVSLYDLNKQIIQQLEELTQEEISKKIHEMNEWRVGNYYLLYGKDISYFTLLKKGIFDDISFGELIIECLNNIGHIKSIELTKEQDAFEIWVSDDSNEVTCLYLFNYDGGVEEYA